MILQQAIWEIDIASKPSSNQKLVDVMLPLLQNDKKPAKCLLTSGPTPAFIDVKNTPKKKKPWAAVIALKWFHTIDMTLPAEVAQIIRQELANPSKLPFGETVRYARVMLKLSDIIEPDFFSTLR